MRSDFIEIDNKFYKECIVIMKDTFDRNAKIGIDNVTMKLYYQDPISSGGKHIYVVSDDEIHVDDCFYHNNGMVLRAIESNATHIYVTDQYHNNYFRSDCKKVIASTDLSLRWMKQKTSGYKNMFCYPELTRDFLIKYCAQGGIEKILVEYDRIKIGEDTSCVCGETHPLLKPIDGRCQTCGSYQLIINDKYKYTPKSNDFSCIVVKEIEQKTYTQIEVENLLNDLLDVCKSNMVIGTSAFVDSKGKEWICEQLKKRI